MLFRPVILEIPASAVLLRKSEGAEGGMLERVIGEIPAGDLIIFEDR